MNLIPAASTFDGRGVKNCSGKLRLSSACWLSREAIFLLKVDLLQFGEFINNLKTKSKIRAVTSFVPSQNSPVLEPNPALYCAQFL